MKIGQANGEFLAHIVEVVNGRRTLEWLRAKWTPEVNRDIALANLKHWHLTTHKGQ